MPTEPTGTEPVEPTGDPEPSPAPHGDPSGWEAEKADLIKNHNAANKRARQLADKVKELESKLSEITKTTPEPGDPAKLRETFANREKELTQQIQALNGQVKERDKRDAFMRHAGLFVEKSVEQVWKLVQGDLDVVEEDGKFSVIVRDSHLSVGDYLKKFADENDYFAKNPGKAGTGANGAGKDKNGKATSIPGDFGSWSKDRKVEWMRENPALAAEAAAKALGG